MAEIKINIDSINAYYLLNGDIEKLKSKRRAYLFLRDYLNADCSNNDYIKIPFEVQEREGVLQDIQKIIKKFGFQENLSENVKNILKDYFQEEENFREFSRKAYTIRNNELDDEHTKEFEEFTNILIDNLPTRRLYELQLLSAYHLAFSQNACNFSVPGSGKTSIVYGAYAYLKNLPKDDQKHVNRLLIIGPLSSFGPWESEYEECFGIRPTSKRLSGGVSKDERINHFYSSNPAEISLLSYKGVINMLEDLIVFLKKFKVMVVLDEAHHIKNIEGGTIATSVLSIAKYCKARVVLTGTPAPNGYEDIYNLFNFIWPNKRIIQYHLFQLKDMSSNRNDSRVDKLIKGVSPYFIRIRKSNLDIPNPLNHPPTWVKMGDVQREIYEYIESSYMPYFMRQEANQNMGNLFAKARLIRLMQVSTNPALLQRPIDEFFIEQGISNETFIDDSEILGQILNYKNLETPKKFLVAGELINEIIQQGEKVIVWATFVQNISDFQDYLSSIGIESKILYGATPIEQNEPDENIETRESIIREFHKDDSSFKVIIANPFAVGESISLHKACKNAIYLERTFDAAHFIQSKDRIHRFGLKPDDRINYYYVLSDNATDRTIHERLEYKERRMMEIIENEPIPLFSILESEDTNDIKALIKNYVNQSTKI